MSCIKQISFKCGCQYLLVYSYKAFPNTKSYKSLIMFGSSVTKSTKELHKNSSTHFSNSFKINIYSQPFIYFRAWCFFLGSFFFLIWHTIYSFQVCYIVIWHLCTPSNDPHGKSSYHLSLHIVNIMLPSRFPMLHSTSPWHIYFTPASLYFSIPFTHFTPTSLVITNLVFWGFFLFCFFSNTNHSCQQITRNQDKRKRMLN